MDTNFWRIRLGDRGNGELWNLCKNERPSCIAVGWGKLDLSKGIDDIKQDYEKSYNVSFSGIDREQIRNWAKIKKDDIIVVMRTGGVICSVGKVISERYYKNDARFRMYIKGYNLPQLHEVLFYNRIDIEWLTNPDNDITKVQNLEILIKVKNKLRLPKTVVELTREEYDLLKIS